MVLEVECGPVLSWASVSQNDKRMGKVNWDRICLRALYRNSSDRFHLLPEGFPSQGLVGQRQDSGVRGAGLDSKDFR